MTPVIIWALSHVLQRPRGLMTQCWPDGLDVNSLHLYFVFRCVARHGVCKSGIHRNKIRESGCVRRGCLFFFGGRKRCLQMVLRCSDSKWFPRLCPRPPRPGELGLAVALTGWLQTRLGNQSAAEGWAGPVSCAPGLASRPAR